MSHKVTIPCSVFSQFEAIASLRHTFPASARVQVENAVQVYRARRRRPVGRCPLTLFFADWQELESFVAAVRRGLPGTASPAVAAGVA